MTTVAPGDCTRRPGRRHRPGAGRDGVAGALAWLLHRSPVVLPIPGTRSVDHLTENLGAARVTLSYEDIARLDALA